MSQRDFQTFTLDVTTTSSVEEVVEAIIQRKHEAFEEQLQLRQDYIEDLEREVADLKQQLEDIRFEQ